jgi:hypothetical protein
MNNISIYEIGSEVTIKNAGLVGFIEKCIISGDDSIQYRIVSYTHGERVIEVYNSFELSPLNDTHKSTQIGFTPVNTTANNQQVDITVADKESVLEIDAPDNVDVNLIIVESDEANA